MKSHNYFHHAISVYAALFFLTSFSQTVSDSSGKSPVARRTSKASIAGRSRVAQPLGAPNGLSETNTSKSLKLANLKEMIHTPSETSAAKFAEVEITLNDRFGVEYICDLPKAPSSDVQILDGGKRVKVQLPVDIVQALTDEGAEISVLRNFLLVEGSKGRATKEDGGVTTLATCSGLYRYGENSADVPIPEASWTHSPISISGAPGASVKCIDVHYEIKHTCRSDLDVDLNDEDLTCEAPLWRGGGGQDCVPDISETKTGITACNGEMVNQTWHLFAIDWWTGDTGYIDYWWIKVYYDGVVPPPPNDDCNNAIAVQEGVPYEGSTVGATGVYASSCSDNDYADVWHSYAPAGTGVVTISLKGSEFDTALCIFDECSGTELACNDDTCEGVQSQITMNMTEFASYLIRIAGYDGATGDYTLAVTQNPCLLPSELNDPNPADGTPNVPVNTILSWNGDGAKTAFAKSEKTAMSSSSDTMMPKVIYGKDDRLDEYDVNEASILAAGDSTVALVCWSDLTYNGDGTYSLPTKTLDESLLGLLCPDEPFRDQPISAFCSGFLVAPDVIATAGHCADLVDCNDIGCQVAAVFGFVMSDADKPELKISESEVYYCTEVLASRAGEAKADWALVRLDREVMGHSPLQVRHTGIIPDDEELLVIGHPVGLPRKYAGGARIRDNNDLLPYFQANLDTYGGNSGGPVFSANTLQVEGVLVMGNPDWAAEENNGCLRSNVCPDDVGCPPDYDWESVARATEFSAVIPSFDVYLGTDCDELSLICQNAVVPWCNPGPLQPGTTYHWQVVAKNPCGQTEGACWSFTTEESPTITGWEIGAAHEGGVGELLCPISEGYVEPRTCGISKLCVSFGQAMDTSVTDASVISIYGQMNGTQPNPCSIGWDGSNSIMEITLCSALPDQDTYTITVSSDAKSAAGCALAGDRDICITALKGDVNSSREVNAQDMLPIRPHAGDSVDGANARYDINCNGAINAQDMLAVRSNAGHDAPDCP